MMGRNDPCLCGSGKKYKKCCGSQGMNLVELVVNEELDRILSGFFKDYPREPSDRQRMQRLMREWNERLSNSWNRDDIEEASSEYYLFIHNPNVWRNYWTRQLREVERESVLSVLQEWENPHMLLGEIIGSSNTSIQVADLFGDRIYELRRNEGMPIDEGTLVFGIVLRDPRQGPDAVAPVSSMIFLARWSKQTKTSLVDLRAQEQEKPHDQFIADHALDIYELFIKRSVTTLNEMVEEVLLPSQLRTLTSLDTILRDSAQPSETKEMLHKLAVVYFLNEPQEVVLEGDFLTAIWKLGVNIGMLEGMEDETVQSEENVQASRYFEELTELYSEMLGSGEEPAAIREYEIGTAPRPTEKGLWETAMTTGGVVKQGRKPGVDGSRAQLLAYEAYAAESEEQRTRLAESAAAIGPSCPDVLLLQAEKETDPGQAARFYEKAIREASRVFEPGENPWMNIPNRPFMRAAFAFGVHLFRQQEYDEAASVFLDLLKMNRTDNQGARYEAVASLIHAGRFREAAEIMVRYERGSANDATYLYLDWKLECEASEGKSESAEEMLELAKQANSHVMHLMLFKAKTIPYPRYLKITQGSEEEARYIWLLLNGAG
ncbi:SEC-C metal-binding domain-containing protein [Sporosarcina sp. 179-K 3D1 HS]|uniref:SEC-C metal-binding domain-containing protein n=1 Tax=Sporosarcina sp. 179-K 3D1 HS TaxID=3232169 RepID=UPI0039A015FC